MKLSSDRFKIRGDKVIWLVYLLLMFVSLVEVYSAMGKEVYEKNGGDIMGMFIKQFLIIVVGLLVTYFVHLIRYSNYAKYTKLGFVFSIVLLVFTLIYGHLTSGKAGRWLPLPLIGQFQPSELVKFILVMYVANELAILKEGIRERKNFLVLIGKIVPICLLIFTENFSTAALIFLCCYILIFVAGAKMKQWLMIVPAAAAFILLIAGIYLVNPDILNRSETWKNRVEGFIHDDKEQLTQANIAEMAIATGGYMGKGIGETVEGRFLSESHNDFIFAIILEEGGVIFGLVVIMLYFVLFYRSIRVAKQARGRFGSYTAIGIGIVFSLQAVVNMMVATSMIPVTGQTLPFISYGGTSFVISSAALGVLLNISADAKKYQAELRAANSLGDSGDMDARFVAANAQSAATDAPSVEMNAQFNNDQSKQRENESDN